MFSILRRPVVAAVLAVAVLAVGVTGATVATLSGERDRRCPDDDFGCAEFLPGEPILIGVLFTGDGIGEDVRRGALLAVEGAGGRLLGRPLELAAYDDGCTPLKAARSTRELASDPPREPPVVAVVGAACPPITSPVAQILSDSGITLLSWSTAPVSFRDPPRSFFLRLEGAPSPEALAWFRDEFEERFGHRPRGTQAWQAATATGLVIRAADRIGKRAADGAVLVPRTGLHEALVELVR